MNEIESLAKAVRNHLEGQDFEGSLKFDCGEDGVLVLDNGKVSVDDQETDCDLTLKLPNLEKLLKGQLNPTTAVMLGKIKLSGNAGVAIRLSALLKS